jgi:fatty-acid peroxygenase
MLAMAHDIPRDPAIDSTIFILRDGYEFIWKRCQRLGSVAFRTRIMGQKAVCIHGPDAAQLFYDEGKLQRRHAMPRRVVTSLFGKNAVHTLDDAAHRQRKAAFLGLMSPPSMERLMDITAQCWRRAIRHWEQTPEVELFAEAQCILTEAICTWAGIPANHIDLPRRSRDFGRMVDAFGGVGPRLWSGKLARMRTERWIRELIRKARDGEVHVEQQSALYVMAHHRELNGERLPEKTAAVELINVLRPTVAISWYVTFAALALHQNPSCALQVRESSEYADLFMQEVRRFYPFTPYLGAMVRNPFEWCGHRFEPGTLVLLDVYGTHHDPAVWKAPEEFRPERFREWPGGYFDFMPQGGGRHVSGHRCPGEWITMHNIALALHFLTRCMIYEVPAEQDLRYTLARMPTRPRSGFRIRNVSATAALEDPAPRLPSRIATADVARGDADTQALQRSA